VFDEREDIAHGRPLSSQLGGGELLSVCHTQPSSDPKKPGGGNVVKIDNRPWSQSAAVVIENKTGRVIAITGGNDVTLEGFVRGAQAHRQPGSSFKPYVYASALEHGHTQLDVFQDAPIYLPAGNGTMWAPKNYGGGYSGPVTLRQAIARSLNTVSVRITLESGPTEVARIAHALGVKSPLRTDMTLALGSSEVTPLDQATAYSSIARLGVPIEPRFLDQVMDGDDHLLAVAGGKMKLADGSEVQLPGAPGPRALPANVVYQLIDLMRNVVQNGTGRKVYDPNYDRAGKTGTTSNCVDAWFAGYTPLYTVIVWTGTDGSGSLGASETGGKASLPAWKEIIDALPDQKGLQFAVPDEVVRIDTDQGLLGFARGHAPAKVMTKVYAGTGPLPPLPN